MTFDPKKPVQTRGGRKARIVATDVQGTRPILALIESDSFPGKESIMTYLPHGSFYSFPHGLDLVNIPEKKYINVYVSDGLPVTFNYAVHNSIKSLDKGAQRMRSYKRIGYFEITEDPFSISFHQKD